jgi:dipeptidyl aminopeptidase/acylaminoacyl peptidase
VIEDETEGAVPQAAAHEADAAEAARQADFDRYFAVRNHFGNLTFSPDGSQVAYIVNTSGQFNIWRQPVVGGWASQVTTFERETVRGLVWAHGGVIFGIADTDGSEQYQLFSVPENGGVVRFLTHRPDVQHQLSEEALSPDGVTLAFSGNDREPTDSDILLYDLASGDVRRALANGRYNVAANWSPDGRYLTVIDLRSNTDLRLHLLEPATGAVAEILPHEGEFVLIPGPWLPDSSAFYVVCDRGREFKGIARYSLASGDVEWIVTPEWDVEHIELSDDGRRLVWAQNESGRSQLYVRDDQGTPMRVVGMPIGVIEQLTLSPDGTTLALRINAANAPAEVYVVTLGEIGALDVPRLRRLTYGMLGGLAPDDFIVPELASYPTFDGREIPAWLYQPRGVSEHHQAPVVLAIHGGPEAQERVEYRAFYQYLLARGIGILAPNIRGSTGYGVSYQKLIHRDWGGAELKDIEAAAQYLRTVPWASQHRIAVYGGSFGGFATLSAVTRLPDYWAAAVDIVGPSNLLTFVRSVPPTWRRMMTAWVGDPEADAEFLRERSPITYVENVRAPLLVMQGANDPRVVKAESDQMVEQLRHMGREVDYVVFEDEGHGFAKRANLKRGYWLAAEFLQKHLHSHHHAYQHEE